MATIALVVVTSIGFCAMSVAQECSSLPQVDNGVGISLLQAKQKSFSKPFYPQWRTRQSVALARSSRSDKPSHKADSPCGFDVECPREYTSAAVEKLTATPQDAVNLENLHKEARRTCIQGNTFLLEDGGWCYNEAYSSLVRKNGSNTDVEFQLPGPHVVAGEVLVQVLAEKVLLRTDGSCCFSLTDLGAGVGQLGHALKAKLPALEYHGYDGGGNVEEFTNGYVTFADLTLPLQLNRTDWLVSSEVGEHIPSRYEAQVIANMHALNCKGIILTWAIVGQGGNGHVNCHSNEYLINLFESLGYKKNDELTSALRAPQRGHRWLERSSLAFERRDLPAGC